MTCLPHRCALSLLTLLAAAIALPSPAQTPGDAGGTEETIRLYLERMTGEGAGRVDIAVGPPDSRHPLAPCAHLEPSLPPGTRLPGRVLLRVRCLDGNQASPGAAGWTTQLPVTVRLFVPALVATQTIAAQQAISRSDVTIEEVEITRDGGSPVRSFEQLDGRAMTRTLSAGTPLRQEWLRSLPVILAGDTVRLSLAGKGFSLSTDGQALSTAAEGQPVRVKTESGRTLTATARSGRVAEISGF